MNSARTCGASASTNGRMLISALNGLVGAETSLHQIQVGFGDILRFPDPADRQAGADARECRQPVISGLGLPYGNPPYVSPVTAPFRASRNPSQIAPKLARKASRKGRLVEHMARGG